MCALKRRPPLATLAKLANTNHTPVSSKTHNATVPVSIRATPSVIPLGAGGSA